jgi:hypothetical protein
MVSICDGGYIKWWLSPINNVETWGSNPSKVDSGSSLHVFVPGFSSHVRLPVGEYLHIYTHLSIYSWGDQDLSILIGLAKAYIYIHIYITYYYIHIHVSSSILTWWKSMEEMIYKCWIFHGRSPFGRDLSFLPLVCQVSHPRGTAPVVISALRRAKRIFWTYQKIWKTHKKPWGQRRKIIYKCWMNTIWCSFAGDY